MMPHVRSGWHPPLLKRAASPGVRVLQLSYYITIQGTSMAAPHVAGIIALILQKDRRLTPEEVQQRLKIASKRDPDTRGV
jgi:subtilisin family serine protease